MAYGGWLDCGPVGLTENRPVPGNAFEPLRGKTYFDTDLQTLVIYDGVNWRDIMASAVVGRTHPSLMIPLEPSSGGFSVRRGRRIHDFQSCSFGHSIHERSGLKIRHGYTDDHTALSPSPSERGARRSQCDRCTHQAHSAPTPEAFRALAKCLDQTAPRVAATYIVQTQKNVDPME